MSDTWKQWEGQFVEGKFPLRQYLGGSEHSAVFLTERGEHNQKAAIKFIQVEGAEAEQQLSRWKAAAHLFHQHLLRIFESGRCRLGEFDLLYVVMECGQENLGQFLPQRPLTPAEARDVLEPVLGALAYLHREGFVHGHVRPSNIFAIDDEVKLSSDAVMRLSEPHEKPGEITETTAVARRPSVYDAPETARGEFSPASDAWSLGVTLVEALTQRLPISEEAAGSARPPEPNVPETLPALYLEIARNCLQREAHRRWGIAEIIARLNPALAAAASATVAKPSTPAPVPPRMSVSVSEKTETYHVPASARPPLHAQSAIPRDHYTKPRYDMVPPKLKRPPLLPKANYFILGFVGTLVLLAVLVLPRLFGHRGGTEQTSSVEPAQTAAQKTAPAPVHTKNQLKSSSKSSVPASSSVNTAPPRSAAHVENQASPPKPPAISSAKTADRPTLTASSETIPTVPVSAPAKSSSSSSSNVAKGEVLDQVLPEVSQKAQATIRGTVRTSVKLHVDAAGNVIDAELYSPGPSKYFAELALNAARRWDFAPAKLDGHNVPSDWLVRFEFTQTATRVYPTQATP
jgi:TonB family protein